MRLIFSSFLMMNQIKNNKKVAILLATYNGEKYIRTLLDSILSQTCREWTLYIRDDNSRDNTLSIIEEYRKKCNDIVMVEDVKENLGCNGNFYHMLEVVDSDYYMFCDQDDEWLPEKVGSSLQAAEDAAAGNRQRPIIVHSDFALTDDELNIIHQSYWEHIHMEPELYYNERMVSLANPVVGASMILNRELRNLIKPLPGSDMMYDSWISLVCVRNNGVIIPLHEVQRKYRIHSSNLEGQDFLKKRSIIRDIRKIIRMNWSKAKRLQYAGCMNILEYPFYKAKYTLLRKKYASHKKA